MYWQPRNKEQVSEVVLQTSQSSFTNHSSVFPILNKSLPAGKWERGKFLSSWVVWIVHQQTFSLYPNKRSHQFSGAACFALKTPLCNLASNLFPPSSKQVSKASRKAERNKSNDQRSMLKKSFNP